MAHIDNPREEFTNSTGIGIPILIMAIFYISNIAMVVFAVLAFFSFKSDYNCQQELMFSTMKGEETALSRAIESDGGRYSVNYDKLDQEYQQYFDKDKLSSKRSDEGQSQQAFIISLLEDKDIYSPISTKTTVFGVISVGLLAWLILRSLRQIRALY